jgi:uncharacterized membrane protein
MNIKTILNVVGVLLIIGGIVILSYQGFHYTKKEQVAQLGSLEVINTTHETVRIPPFVGGLSLLAGLILVVIGRKNN